MAGKMQVTGESIYIPKMSVKGGKLPNGVDFQINTTIDFTGAKRDKIIFVCASGSSARVRLQGQLRNKPMAELRKLEMTGYKTTFDEVLKGAPEATPGDKLAALSREDFTSLMMTDYGVDEATAEKMYFRKHPELVEEEEDN